MDGWVFKTSPIRSAETCARENWEDIMTNIMKDPEYVKVDGKWLLAEESRMDCVAVLENGRIVVREFRLLKKGDLVLLGRTEKCEDGIYMHVNGFCEEKVEEENFAFRRNRSRETAYSLDYTELYQEVSEKQLCCCRERKKCWIEIQHCW